MSETNVIASRYKVIKHIGQGGMADVFVAVDTILRREVAIKILRGELSSDPTSVLRFKREAHASTSLSHPNIVDIYDVGEYKGHHYIVMEYVKGKTLKQLINERGSLLKEEAVDIMKQLSSAIEEAHNRGIIHRDIKPQNVLITPDGTIKVLDFGIALAQDALQLTQSDSIMGSVHYLAPELARGEQASKQSDIYSLGIVFYEMLAGDVPFKAEQAIQVALMHMRDEMPSIRAINSRVPQSIENIIIKATAKNKGFRYKDVKDLLLDLSTCLSPERENEKKSVFNIKEEEIKKEAKENLKRASSENKISRFNPAWILLPLLVVFLGAGIFFIVSLSGIFDKKSSSIEIPDIIGSDITKAKETLELLDLSLDVDNIQYELTEETPKGKIFEVEPQVGTSVSKNTSVSVKVSSGIAAYIKDYTGLKIKNAKEDLSQYPNLNLIIEAEDSDSVSPGLIIRQELLEKGARFNPEISTDIKLVYSTYKTIEVPWNIVGMSIDDATKSLQDLGVEVMLSQLDTSEMSDEERANLTTGQVIQTTPAAGTSYTQEDGAYLVVYYY